MDKALTAKYSKGFRGRSNNNAVLARRRAEKAACNQYISRRLEKRDMRSQWIQQINAASRQFGMTYGQLMHGLTLTKVALNRKMLAELAVNEPFSFSALTEEVKKSIVWQDRDRTRLPKSFYGRFVEDDLPPAFEDSQIELEAQNFQPVYDKYAKATQLADEINKKLIKDGKAVLKVPSADDSKFVQRKAKKEKEPETKKKEDPKKKK